MSIKRNDELKKGDVIHTQFGDCGNWITAVVESAEKTFGYLDMRIKAHMIGCDFEIVMCGRSEETVEVLDEVNG